MRATLPRGRTPAGEVVQESKTPYRNGTTHLVMSPLGFPQRVAALVPSPRFYLISFHGVLAPHAALRSQVVPGEADPATDPADGDGDSLSASPRARMSWAQLLKRVFAIDITACPQCGGRFTILPAIIDPTVIVKILANLGLPTRVPLRSPARIDEFFLNIQEQQGMFKNVRSVLS